MLSNILLMALLANHMISGEIEVNTGAYFQSLPETIAYETTLPIVLEIKYLSVDSIKALRKCFDSACRDNSNTCEQFENRINNTIQGIYSLNINKSSILAKDGESLGWEFQIADRNHVKRMFTSNSDISNLKKRIQSYMLPVELFELKSIHFMNNDPCASGNVEHLAGKLQGILLFITNLVSACHNKHLVPEILDMKILNEHLLKFKNQINAYGYRLAVEEISQYYNLPITDCMLSPDKALLGIHVPIIKKEIKSIELRRLIPARLAWNDLTCSLSNTHTDIAIIMTTTGEPEVRSFECDPHRDRLCLLSRTYVEHSLSTACISILLTGGAVDSISKLCPITCQDTDRKTRVITPINQNTFLMTHVQGILKHFYNNTEENIAYEQNYGTIWVELPCNHSLKFSDNKTLLPTFPCVTKLVKFKIKQVIPTAWSSLKTLTVPEYNSDRFPKFRNLKECLDSNSVIKQTDNHLLLLISPWFAIFLWIILAITVRIVKRRRHNRVIRENDHWNNSNRRSIGSWRDPSHSNRTLNTSPLTVPTLPGRPLPSPPPTASPVSDTYLTPVRSSPVSTYPRTYVKPKPSNIETNYYDQVQTNNCENTEYMTMSRLHLQTIEE